ncbi:MAG: DivIVA domain-containing protein, partial [Acutalibacter sp.]
FIDEVVESFTQLLAERDDTLQQEAQLDQQVKELTNQVAQLKAKNAELQKKLGILAQKIESYREEEDGIKEAILSAQKIGKDAIQEAKDKAAVMLADAEENAKALLANARDDAAKAAREYAIQVEQAQRAGGDEAPGVRVPRLFAGDVQKHLESINHIPSFRWDTQ